MTVPSDAATRARRWDAVVLGTGIASLVVAIRLGRAGHRILVVEESDPNDTFPGLREPFLLTGARDSGVLDAALRELAIPLIDRRRIVADPLTVQVLAPEYRVDIGEAELTASEFVSWGLAKPDEARDLVRALVVAGEAERQILLNATQGRVGKSLSRTLARGAGTAPAARGLPHAAAAATAGLSGILDALVRALSHQAEQEPAPEAKARLLGSVLAGGARFRDGPPWLWGLLRRRVESVYAEFRQAPGGFRIVQSDGQAGIQIGERGELWLGRALVIGASTAALAGVLEPGERPPFITPRPARQRHLFHWRLPRHTLPEAMAPRVISLANPGEPLDGGNLFAFAITTDRDEPQMANLVAQCFPRPAQDRDALEALCEARLRELMPFAGDALKAQAVRTPRWDDDGWLEDGPRRSSRGAEPELRVSGRPAVYRLERGEVAGLGLEGDLLLGWRAGDSIVADLG